MPTQNAPFNTLLKMTSMTSPFSCMLLVFIEKELSHTSTMKTLSLGMSYNQKTKKRRQRNIISLFVLCADYGTLGSIHRENPPKKEEIVVDTDQRTHLQKDLNIFSVFLIFSLVCIFVLP